TSASASNNETTPVASFSVTTTARATSAARPPATGPVQSIDRVVAPARLVSVFVVISPPRGVLHDHARSPPLRDALTRGWLRRNLAQPEKRTRQRRIRCPR